MPIKVLGVDPKALKQITCTNCANRLEYTKSDLKDYKDYAGGHGTYLTCPVCQYGITLS